MRDSAFSGSTLIAPVDSAFPASKLMVPVGSAVSGSSKRSLFLWCRHLLYKNKQLDVEAHYSYSHNMHH